MMMMQTPYSNSISPPSVKKSTIVVFTLQKIPPKCCRSSKKFKVGNDDPSRLKANIKYGTKFDTKDKTKDDYKL